MFVYLEHCTVYFQCNSNSLSAAAIQDIQDVFHLSSSKAVGHPLRLRDPRAVGVARQFVQAHFSPTKMKLVKSNLLDAKQGR